MGEIGSVVNRVLTWDLRWRISLFLREILFFKELLSLLWDDTFSLYRDKCIWKHVIKGTFLVASTYLIQMVCSISSLTPLQAHSRILPLYGLVGLFIRYWSSLNDFWKINFCQEKTCLRERWFFILVGSFIPYVGFWLSWFLLSFLLVRLLYRYNIESLSDWGGRKLSLMILWCFLSLFFL